MLAPGLANAVLAQHFMLEVFPYLLIDFASLLKKLLFLGRTLLLRLWVVGTHVRKRLGGFCKALVGGKGLGGLGSTFEGLGGTFVRGLGGLPGEGC